MAQDRWKGFTSGRTRAGALVEETAAAIRRDVQQMLLEPGLSINFGIIEQYQEMLRALERFAQAVSESNPGYWRKDLSKETQDDLDVADHALHILLGLYGPKEA